MLNSTPVYDRSLHALAKLENHYLNTRCCWCCYNHFVFTFSKEPK